MRYAMIMAGGAGTRLWPMSRQDRPKQILKFIRRGGDAAEVSLLELAAGRLTGLVEPANRYICTAEGYRGVIRAQLPDFGDEQVLGEPVGRDTVNAVGLTAAVLHKKDKDAVFCVLTADHVIEPEDVFRARMDLGFRLVDNDPRRFVTFSIKPTYPATGFGYVERGTPIRDGKNDKHGAIDGVKEHCYHVARFVEKPDAARAEAYVKSGDFGWNSGMFVWKASSVLEALKLFKPESYEGLMKIQAAWGTRKQKQVLEEVYPTLPKISVDYALMEPASRQSQTAGKAADARFSVCTVQMDLTWLDVGSWPSYAQTLTPDKNGNRASGAGVAAFNGSRNNLVVSQPGHTVALLGCENMIVVQTPDATLVMPATRSEDLKSLHAQLPDSLK
ncbi:MAG: mannose-1-phosphate guanylyltransferase [Leptolyngbya sp. PLA1]|nr:mannose-1-phosphate guanylyltransferase [Leptolyngbya sp. PLA1]